MQKLKKKRKQYICGNMPSNDWTVAFLGCVIRLVSKSVTKFVRNEIKIINKIVKTLLSSVDSINTHEILMDFSPPIILQLQIAQNVPKLLFRIINRWYIFFWFSNKMPSQKLQIYTCWIFWSISSISFSVSFSIKYFFFSFQSQEKCFTNNFRNKFDIFGKTLMIIDNWFWNNLKKKESLDIRYDWNINKPKWNCQSVTKNIAEEIKKKNDGFFSSIFFYRWIAPFSVFITKMENKSRWDKYAAYKKTKQIARHALFQFYVSKSMK